MSLIDVFWYSFKNSHVDFLYVKIKPKKLLQQKKKGQFNITGKPWTFVDFVDGDNKSQQTQKTK